MSRLSCLILAVGLTASCGAQVVVSEFMAKNDGTLADGDGNFSDWIELHNTSSNTLDLTGWYLSDDTNSLTEWTFPTTSLGGGEYLVVFASGQDVADYVDGLGYLHTTFKLSGDGENVILTKPDGTTVEHAYYDYPEQDDDVSYGYGHDVSYSFLVVEGQDASAIEGSSEPSNDWKTPLFDDSTWLAGHTGVGYESRQTIYGSLIGLALPEDMYRRTYSTYVRVPFTASLSNELSQLVLRMKYDDGFVAYINGVKVASVNSPVSPTYASIATAENDGSTYQDFTLLDLDGLLVEGNNILAIHSLGFNQQRGRDFPQDQFVMPVLTGLDVGDMQTNAVLYLESPTPGTANVEGVLGYVGDTTFSVDRGFYTNAFDVEIACKTEGADIYYTTDGTSPSTENGTLYNGAVTIDRTTVLRAAAFVTGYQPSDIDTQTYIFLNDVITQSADPSGHEPYFPATAINNQVFDYEMDPDVVNDPTYSGQIEDAMLDIRTISLVTDPDNLFDASSGIYVNPQSDGYAWERPASIELIHPDGSDGFQINGGVRIRGGSSRNTSNPKHSFRFFFRSEYGTSRLNYDLFGDEGVDSFKRIDFRTGQNFSWQHGNSGEYSTWLYDIFVRDVHREMGQPYTRGWYFHLYVNGMYWGLFQTEERPEARYAESYYGGDNDNFDVIKSGDDQGLIEATDGELDAYQELWAGVNSGVVDNAAYFKLQGLNADGTDNGSYTNLLDVDNVIDYMLSVFYVGNRDSPLGPPNNGRQPRNLFALYNRANPDGYKFVGHDSEHALGYHLTDGVNYNFVSERSASVEASTTLNTVENFNPWWLHLQLMNNEEYKLRFADRVNRHLFNDGILTPEKATEVLLARKTEMDLAIIAESARWGDYVSGTPRTKEGDWEVAVDNIINTYLQASPSSRRDIVFGQLEAMGWMPSVSAPVFGQHGGSFDAGYELPITGSGTIYYTLDGSDPRAIGGAVSGTAYSGEVPLNHSARVKARALDNGEWSALTEATFLLSEPSPVLVTEIMYNPLESEPEFVELFNAGSETIGLAGMEFIEGIHFDFSEGELATLAPGEYAVLVNDYDAFTNKYANWAMLNLVGQYHGKFFIPTASLDNAGEDIGLVDGFGNTILNFEYDDWYEATDGEGFSLTLIDPYAETSAWGESSSWRASKYAGGTPGYAAEEFLNPEDLVISEALTHQDDDTPGDWVELYNASANDIDINGWFISDDEDDLTKVELSGLPIIGSGEYLVLTEYSHFGTHFALSELGDEIFISSGEGGALTGFRTMESFGAAERDVTFGRHVKNDGSTDFTAQRVQTYGSENAYPLIGDVVITEIMYHPADSNAFEFIEIQNRTDSDMPLYHETETSNVWKLEGAVEYAFPLGTVLGAGEVIILSETNSAAFQAYYGVPVFGTYTGKLDNDGEELLLMRPGNLEELTGEVPYIVVERVDFNDALPWPLEADGQGASLVRADVSLYPNDSNHWKANASPSPGTTNEELIDPAVDWDGDGASNYDEYIAGTDPLDETSRFCFQSLEVSDQSVFTWSSASGRVYSLWYSTNLIDGAFELSESLIPATPPQNTYTGGVEMAGAVFYQLRVEDE